MLSNGLPGSEQDAPVPTRPEELSVTFGTHATPLSPQPCRLLHRLLTCRNASLDGGGGCPDERPTTAARVEPLQIGFGRITAVTHEGVVSPREPDQATRESNQMIGTDTIDRVIGSDVFDESGDKIGSATEVYLDDETGRPEWVTVKTGMFGTKQSFVPIRDADLTDDGVRVPISKDRVKDAPKIDADGHLSPEEEMELYRYYGMSGSDTGTQGTGRHEAAPMRDGDALDRDTRDRDTTGTGTVGRDTSGPTTDDAMTRSEERMDVGTRTEETGRARMRKYVVSENATETVPVSHEEVRLEREPITDGTAGAAMDGPAISEEEHEVTLHAERPVVEKEAVPVERVRLDTETVTDEVQVSEELRKEQIEVDGADEKRRH